MEGSLVSIPPGMLLFSRTRPALNRRIIPMERFPIRILTVCLLFQTGYFTRTRAATLLIKVSRQELFRHYQYSTDRLQRQVLCRLYPDQQVDSLASRRFPRRLLLDPTE